MNEPNGFSRFYGTVTNVNEIHVYQDSSYPERMWRARGWHGDYGIARTRDEAIKIAMDAKVTSLFDAKIYVHRGFSPNTGKFIITKVKKAKPTSQFFQDSVS